MPSRSKARPAAKRKTRTATSNAGPPKRKTSVGRSKRPKPRLAKRITATKRKRFAKLKATKLPRAPRRNRDDFSVAVLRLCARCGRLVDNDESTYTLHDLEDWKSQAIARAHRALETGKVPQPGPSENSVLHDKDVFARSDAIMGCLETTIGAQESGTGSLQARSTVPTRG